MGSGWSPPAVVRMPDSVGSTSGTAGCGVGRIALSHWLMPALGVLNVRWPAGGVCMWSERGCPRSSPPVVDVAQRVTARLCLRSRWAIASKHKNRLARRREGRCCAMLHLS